MNYRDGIIGLRSIRMWSPDTCGCTIHLVGTEGVEGWIPDTYCTTSEAQVIHGQYRKDNPDANPRPQPDCVLCVAHDHLGESIALYTQINKENSDKNMAWAQVEALMPGTVDPNNFKWEFDSNRKLKVSYPGISGVAKAEWRAVLDPAIEFTDE